MLVRQWDWLLVSLGEKWSFQQKWRREDEDTSLGRKRYADAKMMMPLSFLLKEKWGKIPLPTHHSKANLLSPVTPHDDCTWIRCIFSISDCGRKCYRPSLMSSGAKTPSSPQIVQTCKTWGVVLLFSIFHLLSFSLFFNFDLLGCCTEQQQPHIVYRCRHVLCYVANDFWHSSSPAPLLPVASLSHHWISCLLLMSRKKWEAKQTVGDSMT